jgi:hypothetical protein
VTSTVLSLCRSKSDANCDETRSEDQAVELDVR